MAKVTGPLNSIEARGRVGALVYNTWRGLHTVKTHTDPATQYSDKQIAIRALGNYCTGLWQDLSDDLRREWDKYAIDHPDADWSGNDKRLSGYNMFLRLGVRSLLLDETVLGFPPVISVDHILDGFQSYFAPPGLFLGWNIPTWSGYDDYRVEVYCSAYHGPARHPSIKDCSRNGYTYAEDGVYTVPASSGYWTTCYARLMHITGLSGGWQSARGYKP